MAHWVSSSDEQEPHAGSSTPVFNFAAEQAKKQGRIVLELETGSPVSTPPTLVLQPSVGKCEWRSLSGGAPSRIRYEVILGRARDLNRDDEVIVTVEDPSGAGVPPCKIVLRRSTCKISTGLMRLGASPADMAPQTQAALLWLACNRYSTLVVLKRFTTGFGGSDVLVVRRRLRAPERGLSSLESSGPNSVLEGSWGSCLLVKTGEARKVRKEWDRYNKLLRDRLHPFLARCEDFLPIRAASMDDQPSGPPAQATLISSFVGGDLVHPEPLEEVIRGTSDFGRCNRLVEKVFTALAPWQVAGSNRRLARWRRVYRGKPNDWLLFGKFDLTKKTSPEIPMGRNEFGAGLRWDTSFIEEQHLHHHLLGKKRDGLLFAIREKIRARFSLTQGDLNPRNVLCDGEDIWLIDFEHAGVAPTLMDYARLEANLRLGCLPLRPAGDNLEDAARALEIRLLDHFLGSEGGIEPTRELAASLGADADDLHKIAHIITHIRRLAAPHCLPIYADRRDYLAVLYLTVLSLLQYSGRRLAPPENYRVLVSLAWVLEEVLDRILGRPPHDRGRVTLQPKHLLTAEWILPPGAPQRVVYFLKREDGRRALDSLAATRDVLQYPPHHLDVLDHILLVLANVEAMIEATDPLGGLLDPATLDLRVEEALDTQGIDILPIPEPEAHPPKPDTADLAAFFDAIQQALAKTLADESSRLLLKWTGLLHDVGKPGTRSVHTEEGSYKVQFIGHEIYGLQLLEGLLRHLFLDPVAAGGGLLERIRRLIQYHHLHHQIVQRYKDHPASLQAVVDGLKTREVPDAEYSFLAKFLEPDLAGGRIAGDYQPDFPLLILFGLADRLACRGPDNVTSVPATARTDLVVLAFWALYPEIKARRLRRKRKRDQPARILRRVSERLKVSNRIDDGAWEKLGSKVVGQLRHWCEAERQSRTDKGKRGPLLRELLAQGQTILDDRQRRSSPDPAGVSRRRTAQKPASEAGSTNPPPKINGQPPQPGNGYGPWPSSSMVRLIWGCVQAPVV
jgi:putative nucleotidyltransferase with HDIG domain